MKYYVISRDEFSEKVHEQPFEDYAEAWNYYADTTAEIGCGGSGSVEIVTRDTNGYINDVLNYRDF